jgi:MFS family permease|mmetsp:Transcript_12899/g.17350  ORF Transcript_12899/g.17350 Transcript_12899/m.17350 type:complete len:122 (+) Transcript_12899:567-932(+)
MDKHDANKISANSLSYGFIVAVPFALIIGFLYDLIGRKAVIVSTFLAGAVSTFLIPVVAPSVAGYDACKIVFLQTMVVLLCNPFINDYVTVQSRGLAMGFQQVGLTAGNLISVSGIYTATE